MAYLNFYSGLLKGSSSAIILSLIALTHPALVENIVSDLNTEAHLGLGQLTMMKLFAKIVKS